VHHRGRLVSGLKALEGARIMCAGRGNPGTGRHAAAADGSGVGARHHGRPAGPHSGKLRVAPVSRIRNALVVAAHEGCLHVCIVIQAGYCLQWVVFFATCAADDSESILPAQAAAQARHAADPEQPADPDFLAEAWRSALDALDLTHFDGAAALASHMASHAWHARISWA